MIIYACYCIQNYATQLHSMCYNYFWIETVDYIFKAVKRLMRKFENVLNRNYSRVDRTS